MTREVDTVLAEACVHLGLTPQHDQLLALSRYLDLLQLWNRTYNLTSVRDPEAMRAQHLVDCLSVVLPLRRHSPHAQRLLDVGSGGGLPGVPLAVMRPELLVTCVDSVGKKAAFIRQVANQIPLPNLHAAHARLPALPLPPFDVITCRAFASLAHFVACTRSLLKPNGVWMAMKGKTPIDEITELPADIEVFHVEQLSVPGLEAARCVVWMREQPAL